MDNFNKTEELSNLSVECKDLAHMGLVAATMDKLGLISKIDAKLPLATDKGVKVTMGERVAAMIFNGLGFIDTRLYMFPEFMGELPVARLFGKEISAEHFNDDSLGRCLDAISEYGVSKLFTELSFDIGLSLNLLGKSIHIDTTSLTVYGDKYPEDENIPTPKRGYSKSHRHDLRQMVLNLATTGKDAFPIFMESHSGNESDQKILYKAAIRMKELCKQLELAEEFIYVADSAMFCNISKHGGDMKWISRAPESIGLVKKLITRTDLQWQELDNGYKIYSELVKYDGKQQRWVLVYSEQGYKRELKTLENNITKQYLKQKALWQALSKQIFACEADAKKAAKQLAKKLKYHKVSTSIGTITEHASKGRPKKDAVAAIVGYKLDYELQEDDDAIAKAKATKGKFVLASSVLDTLELSDANILKEYKAQSGVESGFKFIKDNAFEVDSIFLKTPSRIDALMMVMTLCLMMYNIAQKTMREALDKDNATIPSQTKKPTYKPTAKWTFRFFRNVQEASVNIQGKTIVSISNISELLARIISYFGPVAIRIYGIRSG